MKLWQIASTVRKRASALIHQCRCLLCTAASANRAERRHLCLLGRIIAHMFSAGSHESRGSALFALMGSRWRRAGDGQSSRRETPLWNSGKMRPCGTKSSCGRLRAFAEKNITVQNCINNPKTNVHMLCSEVFN